MKTLTISKTETSLEEGLFLVNPTWTHLDEQEIKEKLEKGEKLFKVKVEEF
ncbi:MAG: hypothetical protein NTX24_02290 [Candidatus Pacearchaeota archaeon]|nr:hypothetical protein [Candidatus Pacearchaeota archaeon]